MECCCFSETERDRVTGNLLLLLLILSGEKCRGLGCQVLHRGGKVALAAAPHTGKEHREDCRQGDRGAGRQQEGAA